MRVCLVSDADDEKRRRAVSESGATATAVEDLQNRLQQHLATHVTIHHGDKRGRIEIEYYGTDDLQRVVNALGLPQRQRSGMGVSSGVNSGEFTTPILQHSITSARRRVDHLCGKFARRGDEDLGGILG